MKYEEARQFAAEVVEALRNEVAKGFSLLVEPPAQQTAANVRQWFNALDDADVLTMAGYVVMDFGELLRRATAENSANAEAARTVLADLAGDTRALLAKLPDEMLADWIAPALARKDSA